MSALYCVLQAAFGNNTPYAAFLFPSAAQAAPDRLDPWLKRARDSTIRQLQSFAKRLQDDYAAVQAAVALAWSNGQTEGQVNRLKTLKRQMYGRANLDLLERRFLLAA